MASTSFSSTTAFPKTNGDNYDVFLSFRGIDTRNSFTDHLYEKLVNAGIRTFKDDEIDRGEELKPEIERAIKSSEASIIVLSENYATSTWCLDELWLILKQRRECNHFVLPVFYDVDPSFIRKQTENFNIKVKTSTRWTDDNVNRWEGALTKVVDLAGLVLSGSETKFIKDIVDTIYNKLDRKAIYLPPNLIGMDARVQEMNYWLKQSDTQFLVICGMAGSGKLTLAQYITYSNWQYFENISIVERIGSRCKEPHDVPQLREQLFNDIIGGKNRRIPGLCQGLFSIQAVLQTKRALVVLDDIVKPSQLDSFLGAGIINKQSKIIITTMEDNLDFWFKSRSLRYQEYRMQLLEDDESLKLLCLHAFGAKIPKKGYEDLAKQVVQYCDGNPLALEVLGSTLRDDSSIHYWKSAVKLLGKDMHHDIYAILKRSYDSLPYDYDRELFLHIACFFVGKDLDYVVKILEPDYSAVSRIKTLMKRCLLYVTPNKKLMMHRLLQEMGRSIVDRESTIPTKRSRVWRNTESVDMLIKGKGSKTMTGLALDMHMLMEDDDFKLRDGSERLQITEMLHSADPLPEMDQLQLLQLNFVNFKHFQRDFPKHLRWLCWVGFIESRMPSSLCMGYMVALDMSYSGLEEFEPPMVLPSLKILNLKSSLYLRKILFISRLPNLESLIVWNCHRLVHICETIEKLASLGLLNMNGCQNLKYSFSLPHSLERLFLKDCNLECTDDFPLTFSDQPFLQYLNLGNGIFELLPTYKHLQTLRVLELSFCSRLRWLLCLPSTLAELYTYYCTSLEKVTFESGRFTLQEFGYEGCSVLSEIEGFIKLVLLNNLDEADLGHLKWLKKYQNHELCLGGDDELMTGRSSHLQMLYEFNIMSISLPDIKDPNMIPEYISESISLSFEVPLCPKNKRLIGLNVMSKYTVSGDDCVWFAKITTTTTDVDLIYNPKVFGKPESGEICVWLSYWPIGSKLNVGDLVTVSILVMNGFEIHECGATLVYTDYEVAYDTLQNNMDPMEVLGGDLSRFQLSTGAYYLCRCDFFELMQVDRLTPGWFSILVVRGWRKTGRPQQSYQSFTELKTVKCNVYWAESSATRSNKISDTHDFSRDLVLFNLNKALFRMNNTKSRKFRVTHGSLSVVLTFKREAYQFKRTWRAAISAIHFAVTVDVMTED
ncbi:hypothetical protein OSB04_003447 [Centaurea solstitialis]|uniref:TIR domain-containing protein n=1 Tax=Centaurea solstitialis TaxID=347529 RepID=A0AA38U7D9_9ASTR|nr:hypothetical protein OSB04_003447 [Centaurea solstitialis]